MKTAAIASRILLALGASSTLLAATAAGCGSSTSTAAAGTTGSGGGTSTHASSGGGTSTHASSSSTGLGTGGAVATSSSTATGTGGFGGVPACPRRPFLVDAVPRAGGLAERSDWLAGTDPAGAGLDASAASALAEAWAHEGTQEHASIAAFARFTMLLVAVGAPPEIIVGSQQASLDEVAHARGCFGLAKRYGGRDLGPGPVSLRGALPAEASLADVAELTVHEGCVGETLGVLLAAEQLAGATDPVVRAHLERVVRDEQRHAELAWRFVRWALARGGAPVRAAVERAFGDAVHETLALGFAEAPVDAAVGRAHGRLGAAETHALVRRGLAEIVEPCRTALFDRAPGATAASVEAEERAG
jgi:hypothetical protein